MTIKNDTNCLHAFVGGWKAKIHHLDIDVIASVLATKTISRDQLFDETDRTFKNTIFIDILVNLQHYTNVVRFLYIEPAFVFFS